jgi:hypothetical protein
MSRPDRTLIAVASGTFVDDYGATQQISARRNNLRNLPGLLISLRRPASILLRRPRQIRGQPTRLRQQLLRIDPATKAINKLLQGVPRKIELLTARQDRPQTHTTSLTRPDIKLLRLRPRQQLFQGSDTRGLVRIIRRKLPQPTHRPTMQILRHNIAIPPRTPRLNTPPRSLTSPRRIKTG